MTFWDWLWAWTRDPEVWNWIRPALAALAGALVGGGFTFWGQRQALSLQRQRDDDTWTRTQEGERHRSAREDARRLFEDFTNLAREIQDSPESFAQMIGNESWDKNWDVIWTMNRSLSFDVRARLLPDNEVRTAVLELVDFLDGAKRWSVSEGDPAPGLTVGVRTIVQISAAEGIDVMSGYLRGDPYKPTRTRSLETIREARKRYEEWEDHEIASAVAADEARAMEAEEAESDEA